MSTLSTPLHAPAARPAPHASLRVAGRPPRPADGLSRGQRLAVVGAILAAHGLAVWGLLQVPTVRQALAATSPIFVSLITPPAPPAPPPPPVPTPPRPAPPRPPAPATVVAAPTPAPAPFVAPLPEPEPEPEIQAAPAPAVPPAPPAVATPPAPPAPPAPSPPPRNLPAQAVQYLDPPVLSYPSASRRLGEAGRVMVRVYIDEGGQPRSVQVHATSGFPRLDGAAVAAVQKARFKPYVENGRPTAGWAFIPLVFDLEN